MRSQRCSVTRRQIGRGSCFMRSRCTGSRRRSSVAAVPPSRAQAGSAETTTVWLQSCGITSNATSLPSAQARSIASSALRHRARRRAALGLDVRDLQPRARAPRGADRLGETGLAIDVAVAHMRCVEAAAPRRHVGQRVDLVFGAPRCRASTRARWTTRPRLRRRPARPDAPSRADRRRARHAAARRGRRTPRR